MNTINVCFCGWWRQSDSRCPEHGEDGTRTYSLKEIQMLAREKDSLIDTVDRIAKGMRIAKNYFQKMK